ncbi:uncharacterized protein LOC135492795 [Lineus longissimus]|uniref:uncharacterized protein LOC135492795 n=1 Tax=Lineus longissimus TaxID=88925 RepID=UPI00315D7C26
MARSDSRSPIDTMEELIEFFDSQSSSHDNLNASFVDGLLNPPSGYVSQMRVHGTPLLPPLMTKKRKEECLTYRHQAVLAETRLRARKKDELLAKVQEALESVTNPHSKESIFRDMRGQISVSSAMDFDEGIVRPDNITSALSPDREREAPSMKFSETLTSTISDFGSMGITSSYMFQSSDSSECQTTVIARDEDSHFKQVVRSLKEERERDQTEREGDSSIPVALGTNEPDLQKKLDDIPPLIRASDPRGGAVVGQDADNNSSLLSRVNLSMDEQPGVEAIVNGLPGTGSGTSSEKSLSRDDTGVNSAARRRRRNESGSSKSSSAYDDDNLSEYRELPAAGQSKVLGKALDVLKDVAESNNERLDNGVVEQSKENLDRQMFLSGDSNLMCTASTDIMQYMKTSVGTMASSTNTLQGSPCQPDEDARTLTNASVGVSAHVSRADTGTLPFNVVQIAGVETGESSTDPAGKTHGAVQDESVQIGYGGVSSRRGKQDHLQRYLQQLSQQPTMNPNQRTSANLEELGTQVTEMSITTDMNTVRPFSCNFEVNATMPEEDLLQYQASHFEEMRKRLELQQRQQLNQLLWEQQNEQLMLQQDLLDQEERVRRAQRKLLEQQTGSLPSGLQQITQGSPVPHYESSSEDEFSQRSPYIRSDESKSVDVNSGHSQEIDPLADRSEMMRQSEPAYLHGHGQTSPVLRRRPIIKVPEKPQDKNKRLKSPQRVILVVNEKHCMALAPEMKPKFDRISACVKGYLTRRLLRTEKVQDLIKTIKDTAEFAISFQSETPIKKGIYSVQDITLQERVIAQLRAALLEIHEIFFDLPLPQRLAVITHSRQLEEERRLKEMLLRRQGNRRSGNFSSIPVKHKQEERKISAATVKMMERKKKAKSAEDTVFNYAQQARPKTAPPDQKRLKTLDISGPLRRQFQSIFNRALRPIQGQTSPVKPVKEEIVKSLSVDRPKTAPAKPTLHRETSLKSKRTDVSSGTRKTATKTTTQASKAKYSNTAKTTSVVNNKLRR